MTNPQAPDRLIAALPFIDGETLRTKLDRETQLGIEEAVNGGFCPGDFISRQCPFFVSLRGTPMLEASAATAIRRTEEFDATVAGT